MKGLTKKIWSEFIYGGHMLALGLVGTGIITAIVLGIHITWDFVVVVYAPTVAACLFGRYFGLKEDALTNPVRFKHFESKYKKLPYIIACLILVMIGIVLHYEKYSVLVFASGLISLSILYELLFKNVTRKIIGFKNFFSSLLFTLISFLLIIYYNTQISPSFFLIIIYIFLMSFMSTSYSDIKDIKSDGQKGLKTIAVILGEKKLLLFQWLLSTIVGLFLIVCVYLGFLPKLTLALLLGVLYNYFVFWWTAKKNADLDFMVDVVSDAQYFLWLIFIIAGKFFIK